MGRKSKFGLKLKSALIKAAAVVTAVCTLTAPAAVGAPLARAAGAYTEYAKKFNAKVFHGDWSELNYRIYVPEDYDSSKSYPLFVNLHGSGQKGDDNFSQINQGGILPIKLLEGDNPQKYPCIILAPQCPDYDYWVWDFSEDDPVTEAMRLTYLLIDEVLKAYNIDRNRMYVSGNSMGGTGAWEMITRHPEMWAAAVPICGYTNNYLLQQSSKLLNMPIRIYHAKNDPIMPSSYSRNMYMTMMAAGAKNIEYFEVNSADHGAGWYAAYDDNTLLPWMFSQKRNDTQPEFVPPQPLDYQKLNDAITAAGDVDPDRYTEESLNEFSQALDTAKKSFVDMMLTQQELDKIAENLLQKKAGLQIAVINYDEINKLIAKALSIDSELYTAVSVERVTKALAEAQAVVADPQATQKMVNAKKNVLLTALNILKPIQLDCTAINESIKRANSIDLNGYTSQSAAVLRDAVERAQSAIATFGTKQKDIDALKAQIDAAIDGLEKIEVQSVKLNKSSFKLTAGNSAKISAQFYPQNAAGAKIEWRSSNKKVAYVSNGKLIAKSAGKAQITAAAGKAFATASVTVNPKKLKKLSVKTNKKSVLINIKKSDKACSSYVLIKKKGGYKKLCLTKKSKYQKKLAPGNYQIKACSYIKIKGNVYKSAFTKPVKFKIK